MEKLKPCPFCNGEPEIITRGNNFTRKRSAEIKCKGCGCLLIVGAIHFSIAWAVEKVTENWNRREGW